MRTGGVPVLLTESEQNVRCWISLEGGCGKAVDIQARLTEVQNPDPSTRVLQAGGDAWEPSLAQDDSFQ